MRASLLLLMLAILSSPAYAEEFNARVIAVLDGDTVLVLREGGSEAAGNPSASRGARGAQRIKIRLANIDAPEKDQEYGMASKRTLAELVLRKQVQVTTQTLDDYGRTLALLEVDGRNVNEEQVRQGMAWNYSHFFRDPRYRALQVEAQQARRGLWMQDKPTPPWKWRKAHPQDHAAFSK
jgi:endonuclease YncB( thermonuclease family)